MLISGYSKGSDITILNTVYHYSKKMDNGKWSKDALTIIFKDNKTGKKDFRIMYEPEYTYYKLKNEYCNGYNKFFVEKDKVDPITCKYKDLEKSIAEQLGVLQFYYDNIRCGNRKANRELHRDERILSSDIEINNYYRMKFGREYTNNITSIDIAYLDIEDDNTYMVGDFPEPGECPINAISLLLNNTLYTFLLRDKKNKLIESFEKDLKSNHKEFQSKFMKFLEKNVGGYKNLVKFDLDKLNTKQIFYDNELEMLIDLFKLINTLKPDFVLAWNMAFDIPYIIQRIINLGADPKIIMCHPDFKDKYCLYNIDELHKSIPEERGDYADISSYSVFLDQLIQFASRRKGQSEFSSMKLDDIGEAIAGVRKLDYHNITSNLGELPYIDYTTFVMYNMMDVLVQYCIEHRTGDIDYVYNKSIINATTYQKVHRQTIYLANRMIMFMYNKGLIAGNNVNRFKEKPKDKISGAFVADPLLLTDKPKEKINGVPILVTKNANDFDYKALYPSITREFNMSPNTQVGMIDIPEKIYKYENPNKEKKYSRAGAYIENLASGNVLDFCKRWLHLGTFDEVIDDIIEYFTLKKNSFDIFDKDYSNGNITVIQKLNKNKIQVCKKVNKPMVVFRYKKMNNDIKEKINKIIGDIKL